jgi:hypothetical protein
MSARLKVALAGVCSTALGVRLPATAADTPLRGWWPLLVLAGVAVMWLCWATRPGRQRSASGGRVRSVARSAMSAASPGGAGSAARAERLAEHSRRNSGLASGWSVLRRASGWALLRKAGVLRPSLRRRVFRRAIWVGTPLARVGRFLRVWSSCEDVTLRVGGPRMGKSAELGSRILDAPGAVIATSTRTDLYKTCAPVLRAERAVSRLTPGGVAVTVVVCAVLWLWDVPSLWIAGTGLVLVVPFSMWLSPQTRQARPVKVFNPSGTGGLASTVVFNPLLGCEVPKTAIERAGDLMQGAASGDARSGDREFWIGQARRALSALMHAAALGGASMRHVQEWLSDPETHAGQVERLLQRSPSRALVHDAMQFFSTNHTTRSSIITSAMPALAWLADEAASAATEPGEGRTELSIEWLLDNRAVVFMIGAEEAQTAPLLTALTSYIAREARRIAALAPGDRLDPPLTFVLDEAALICTPPLERWTADMGGLGAPIHIGVQSFAQLQGKYGHAGAATILNNTNTLLVFGGTRSPEDLNIYATLVGEREVFTPQYDEFGRRHGFSSRFEPVITRSQLAGLDEFQTVIIKNKMLPMIGRVRPVWKRGDVKAVARARRYSTQLRVLDMVDLRIRTWAVLTGEKVLVRLAERADRARTRHVNRRAERRARREVTARQARARKQGL